MSEKSKKRAGRPLRGEKKRVRTSFTLPPQHIAWLQQKAEQLHKSQSELLDQLIHEAIQHESASDTISRFRFPLSQEALVHFCRKHGIEKLMLFGSILGKDFNDQSDIDILIEFEKERKPNLFEMVVLEQELSTLLNGKKIDLKTKNEISHYFRDEVLKEAHTLYAA